MASIPTRRTRHRRFWNAAIRGATPLEATDHLGVVHRLWPVSDVKVIAEVAAVMGPKPIFVADGHHRYETACNYRDQLAAIRTLDPRDPANFVLMMCVSMSDPGMIVLPTHRLFRGLPAMTAAQLVENDWVTALLRSCCHAGIRDDPLGLGDHRTGGQVKARWGCSRPPTSGG